MTTTEKTESLYAVIRTSGKQFRVTNGQKITVNKVSAKPGDEFKVSEVLLVSSGESEARKLFIGTPLVAGASVTFKVLSHDKDKKVRIFKKKRRTGFTKRKGHRQQISELVVQNIALPA